MYQGQRAARLNGSEFMSWREMIEDEIKKSFYQKSRSPKAPKRVPASRKGEVDPKILEMMKEYMRKGGDKT